MSPPTPARSLVRTPAGRLALALLAVASVAAPATAGGQAASAPAAAELNRVVLRGRVRARATEGPIAGAAIVLERDSVHARTDSTGAFRIAGLVAGPHAVIVRAPGFMEVAFTAELRAGASLEYLIQLDLASAAQELAAVNVVTDAPVRPSYRLVDFERRRKTGRGQYLTTEEIEQSRAATLPDLTRGMRGVSMQCGGSLYGSGCRIQMVRAPRGCQPEYIVDGRAENMFGGVTPVRDIVALEIYTGPSDVPGEFAGTNAGCGVVVIWTRSGPPRKAKAKDRG